MFYCTSRANYQITYKTISYIKFRSDGIPLITKNREINYEISYMMPG
jgi:hypothetical protein